LTTETKGDLFTVHRALRAISGWTEFPEQMVSILDRILNTVLDDEFDGAIIPVLVKEEQPSIVYYACADSDLEWRKLQPLLSAAIGITLTDFDGYAPSFAPSSQVEKLIDSIGYRRIAAFGARGDRKLGQRVAQNLDRLVANVKRKPSSEPEFRSTTSQLLAEFDLGLIYGKYDRARSIISELSTSMRLDAVNIWFLRTRFHAHFDESNEIVESDYFNSLVNVRRSRQVTQDLIEAVYKHDLYKYEEGEDPKGAVNAFRELRSKYGDLFKLNPYPDTPSIGKALLIDELASNSPTDSKIQFLTEAAEAWNGPDRAFFDELIRTVDQPVEEPASPVLDLVSDARDALLWVAARPNDQTRANWGAAFEKLSEEERRALLSNQNYADLYEGILPSGPETPPSSSWAELFEQAPGLGTLQTREFAADLVSSIDLTAALKTRAQIDQFVSMLENVEDVESALPAIPYMVEWLKRDTEWPNSGFVKIYRQIAYLLAFAEAAEESVLDAVADLVLAIVNLGVDASDYRNVVGGLVQFVDDHAAAKYIDWLIDMVEGLLAAPSLDPEIRQTFVSIAVQKFNDFMNWIDADQYGLMKDILGSEDLDGALHNLSATVQSKPSTQARPRSWDGSIAIYSLNESAASRAQDILQNRFPKSDVRINHDHGNTPGLSNLAATSDLFIICSGAAKHAATNAIQSIRRARGANTLYAAGSSSIVKTVTEYTALKSD